MDGRVYATQVVGDLVFVGGTFTAAVNAEGTRVPRHNLAAFSLDDGRLVETWRADTDGAVRALQSDGSSLWVGGAFTRVAGQQHNRVARLRVASGNPVRGFVAGTSGAVRALELSRGDLFVGGGFLRVNGVARDRLAKVDARTGALVRSFRAEADGAVFGLAKASRSRTLYAAGAFSTLSGVARTGVGAVSSRSGATVGPAFAKSTRPTLGLDIGRRGSRLFGAGGGRDNSLSAWSTSSGARLWSVRADGDVQAVDHRNGMVYFGFHDGFRGDQSLKLLAVNARGTLDQTFRPSINTFWGVFAVQVTKRAVVVGGDFTTVSGVPARGWARLQP